MDIDSNINKIHKEINLLKIEKVNNNITKYLAKEFPGVKNLSKNFGNDCDLNHAKCVKCKVKLELFESGSSGIGDNIVGVCPKCECVIDFTNYSEW